MTLPAAIIKLYSFKLFFLGKPLFLKNRSFAFSITDNHFDFGCNSNKIWNHVKLLWIVLKACKISNKSNKRLLRYCIFISENEAKDIKNGYLHLAQIPDFGMGYLENCSAHWGQWWLVLFLLFFPLFHLSLTYFVTGLALQHVSVSMSMSMSQSIQKVCPPHYPRILWMDLSLSLVSGPFGNRLVASLKWPLIITVIMLLTLFSYLCLILVVCIWRHQKHDHANYDQFAPNFGMACKTIQRTSLPNLKLFGPTKTELGAKEVGEFSIM